MKEKNKEEKRSKKNQNDSDLSDKLQNKSSRSRYSSNSDSDEWVEKTNRHKSDREDWMAMTGSFKTYTSHELKPKKDHKDKHHIDSYNPATSSRELNPYWKDGGNGVPQTPESYRKSRPFIKPVEDDDYYTKSSKPDRITASSSSQKSHKHSKDNHDKKSHRNAYEKCEKKMDNHNSLNKSYKWKKDSKQGLSSQPHETSVNLDLQAEPLKLKQLSNDSRYLSDEKMNKLAAKIVKAEIMGDTNLVSELKSKLEAAREYRKQNPNSENEDDEKVMLMSTNSAGNSRPLVSSFGGDPKSKGGKRKAETHSSGERVKYFGNDDKYNLSQMFQAEKYTSNYDDEAELARIASKHKNPNDDLEDIFVDEISNNRMPAKDNEKEKQRAINQHIKMEKSLDGCEYCVSSKNMLKHLMVSCGNKVYVALPSRQSLVKGQCILTTIQHNTCATSLDEDVWEEIMDYRKALTRFYNSKDLDVVFFETATKLHRFPHMVIHCVPLPRNVGDMASIYFKKALLECEAEWSMNKKVVDLKGRNIRKGIPKGLPYFWIDFGMDPGFAHVIEDQQLFPKSFAEEIIGGILDLDHNLWKNPKKEYGDLQRKKVLEFVKEWKHFDIASKKH